MILIGVLLNSKLQVAALPLMIGHYMEHTKIPENLSSSHMGGLYVSSFFLGSFLGSILGGFLIPISSYDISCTVSGIMNLVSGAIVLGLHIFCTGSLLNPWNRQTQNICLD